MSWLPNPGSDVSCPSAVPDREPADGTMSMGASLRPLYPDLMRLLDTDSLYKADETHDKTLAQERTYLISAIKSSMAYQATEL